MRPACGDCLLDLHDARVELLEYEPVLIGLPGLPPCLELSDERECALAVRLVRGEVFAGRDEHGADRHLLEWSHFC
jgi:hypothetical protein